MPEPIAALTALRASTADLVQGLHAARWSDDDVRAPSLCDGWTRGHLLTHVARNADGIAATLAGALRGEIVPRYPGGTPARDAAIEAGAGRPAGEIIDDVETSAQRLDRVLGAVGDVDGWARPAEDQQAAQDWVFHRFREVEIHHVDLDGAYCPDRWPPLLITELLPVVMPTLQARYDGAVRVEVAAAGSVVAELAGSVWQVGSGPFVDVTGPDWAVLAWLVGRSAPVSDALTAAPPLRPWR